MGMRRASLGTGRAQLTRRLTALGASPQSHTFGRFAPFSHHCDVVYVACGTLISITHVLTPHAVVRGHVVCVPSAPPQGSSSSLFEVFQPCDNLYYASWTQVTSLERLQLPVVSVFTPVYSNVHTRSRGQTAHTSEDYVFRRHLWA